MTNKLNFGQFISEKRNAFSLTTTELAKKLGISIGYLCQLECGKSGNLNIRFLNNLTTAFEPDKGETAYIYNLYTKN